MWRFDCNKYIQRFLEQDHSANPGAPSAVETWKELTQTPWNQPSTAEQGDGFAMFSLMPNGWVIERRLQNDRLIFWEPVAGDDISRLRAQNAVLQETILWMTGSADFAPGGQAYSGWRRAVKKLRAVGIELFK